MRAQRTIAVATVLFALGGAVADVSARPAPPPPTWRVTTLEHVDLWLHGFAVLTSDTGRVPFFLRGYKSQITAIKRQKQAFTLLDANARDLSQRFATNPALANAQFVAMYFQSFQELSRATDVFVRGGGQLRASDPSMQQQLQILAGNFRTASDRDWLRLFVQSLQDEYDKYYHAYWTAEQQTRRPAFQAFQEAWASNYYPKLSRFLNNTQQGGGQLVLSLPLGGEGRTINDSKQDNLIAVEFPATPDVANNALFTFVHEAVAKLVEEAINDNTSPADKRTGAASGYVGNGAVQGGALILQKIAPDLVQSYKRFYLKTMGLTPAPNDLATVFTAAFPVPDPILSALSKQIEIVLGGI